MWAPPKRPHPARVLVRRFRSRVGGWREPRPVPPPAVPEGWETGPPDFVGVGVQRAGTSRWFQLLSAHPGVALAPGAAKELHFFDRWPMAHDVPAAEIAAAYARYFPRPAGKITGEWTPCYMAEFWALALLKRAAPDARLLVILRDPIDRYASAIARHERRAREIGVPLRPADLAVAADRSRYATQLRRLFAEFSRDQVLVLQHERLITNPLPELARTWAFLGLPKAEPPAELLEKRVNHAGAHPSLPPEILGPLAASLIDEMERLPELAPDVDLGLWDSWTRAHRMAAG